MTTLPLSPFIDETLRAASVEQDCLRAVEEALVEGLEATSPLFLSAELRTYRRPAAARTEADSGGWSEPIVRVLARA